MLGDERIAGGPASPRSALFGWVAMLLGLGAALFLIAPVVRDAIGERITVESIATANLVFNLVLFGPLIVLTLLLGWIERRRVLRAGRRPLSWGLIGLLTGVGGLAACVLYVWLNGTLRPAPLAEVPASYFWIGLAITLLGVVAEELLFRGWLLSALEDRVGPSLAVLLSALAFSGFHLWAGGASDPIALANLMLGGLWFGLLAQQSGGVIAPIAAHLGWNAAEDLGFGLLPNPGLGDFGAWVNYDMVGSVLWGGSEEGLNSSIAMTLVLTALVIPLLPAFSRDRRAARSA